MKFHPVSSGQPISETRKRGTHDLPRGGAWNGTSGVRHQPPVARPPNGNAPLCVFSKHRAIPNGGVRSVLRDLLRIIPSGLPTRKTPTLHGRVAGRWPPGNGINVLLGVLTQPCNGLPIGPATAHKTEKKPDHRGKKRIAQRAGEPRDFDKNDGSRSVHKPHRAFRKTPDCSAGGPKNSDELGSTIVCPGSEPKLDFSSKPKTGDGLAVVTCHVGPIRGCRNGSKIETSRPVKTSNGSSTKTMCRFTGCEQNVLTSQPAPEKPPLQHTHVHSCTIEGGINPRPPGEPVPWPRQGAGCSKTRPPNNAAGAPNQTGLGMQTKRSKISPIAPAKVEFPARSNHHVLAQRFGERCQKSATGPPGRTGDGN